MTAPMVAVRVAVTGRVQGVGYRAWTVEEAARRSLRGWVRNRHDGSVEAVIIGPEQALAAMIEACRKDPRFARVDDIVTSPAEDDGSAGFQSKPTI